MNIPATTRHRRFFAIAFAIFAVTLATGSLLLAGCGDSTAQTPTFDLGSGSLTTKTSKGPVTQEDVESIVNRKLGDTSLAGTPMIRKATITPGADGQVVEIEINRTSSCHPGQVVGIAVTAAQQIMSAVFRYDDVSRISLTLYGTTDNPEDINTKAVRIVVDRSKVEGLDWFKFNDSTVERLASEFWAEPAIYANWKQYGGSAITDESLKAAANQTTTTP